MQKSFAWITVAASTTQTPHERKNKPTLSGYSGRRQMIHLLHTLLRPNGSGLWLGHLPTHLSPTRERTSIRFYYILVSHYHHYALCSHPPRQTFCCYSRPNHQQPHGVSTPRCWFNAAKCSLRAAVSFFFVGSQCVRITLGEDLGEMHPAIALMFNVLFF